MVFLQKNVPPPNKILTFTLDDYSGGLNNRSSLQILPNEASDLINMKFDDDKIMRKRDGTKLYDETSITGGVLYMDEFSPYNEATQFIRSSATQVFADSTMIATVAGRIYGKNYMGKYYFVDGDKIRVYGKFPQVGDTHTRIVGTVNPANVVLEVTTPPAGFTPLGTTELTGVNVYDYTSGRCWYEPCQNEINDTYKGANVVPAKPKYVEIHGGRLFFAGSSNDDDNVFISDISNGMYFPVFLPIQLPPNSDMVTGLMTFSDSVVVGRHRDIHVIYGNTNRTSLDETLFKLKKVNTHTGFANQDAVDVANNYLFFLGFDGNAYAMSTTKTDVDLLSTQILNTKVDFTRDPIKLVSTDYSTAASVYYNDEWYLSMEDKVMVYSYRHRAWTMYMYSGFSVKCFYIKDYALLYGGDNGRIMTDDTLNYGDCSLPYRGFWKSAVLDMNDPATYKQYREFYAIAHSYTSINSSVDIGFEVDYVDLFESFDVDGIAYWGQAKFGARFLNKAIIVSLPINIGKRGRTIRFSMSNGYVQTGEISTVTELDNYPSPAENTLLHVSSTGQYFIYQSHAWVEKQADELFQPMKIYEITGQYELRGKR